VEEPYGFAIDGPPLQLKSVARREPHLLAESYRECRLTFRGELDLEHDGKIEGVALLSNKVVR
jgi:hypothetical protein